MPVTVQCPFCPKKVKVAPNVAKATCPECLKNFIPIPPEDGSEQIWQGKPIADVSRETEIVLQAPESVFIPEWINLWGFAGLALATAGLLLASVGGIRPLTMALAGLGLLTALAGIPFMDEGHKNRDRVWLALSAFLSGWGLLLALVFPGVLNSHWVLARAVPTLDPNKMVAAPRGEPRAAGRPIDAGDEADAASEVIRQRDVVIGIESMKSGPLPNQKKSFLLVHCWIGNIGTENLPFQGFSRDKNQPRLTDRAGQPLAFVEQRQRVPAKGAPVFSLGEGQNNGLEPLGRQCRYCLFSRDRFPDSRS